MGVYLNPGNDAFALAVQDDIYVDKTGLIAYTNHRIGKRNRYVCVSRPRRFGKSMAAEMLAAYYDRECDSAELFKPFKIASQADAGGYRNQYNVIFLNIQNALSRVKTVEKMLQYIQREILAELREKYDALIPKEETILSAAMEKLYSKSKERFVFIIDEWDSVFRSKQISEEAQILYLDFLRDWLKDKTYVALAYMTGILPIKKYGTHSALNMFDEYSMTEPGDYAEYIGFTENEVKELCSQYRVDFEKEKEWYDGYVFDGIHIYNPKSVVDSIRRKKFANYWTQTETYEALKIYTDMNFDGLKDTIIKMLAGERAEIDYGTFQNDMTTFKNKDDVLTLLVHLGYLAYDRGTEQVFIPNEEIRAEFVRAVKGSQWNEVILAIEKSERLMRETWAGNAEYVAKMMDEVHMANTSILTYNDENSLSCVISLAYYNAVNEYTKIREFPTGRGFADVVFIPKKDSDKPAMIIELKFNKSAEGAIAQIKERKYTESLKKYKGDLLLVGINYDRKTKKHTCVIEKSAL